MTDCYLVDEETRERTVTSGKATCIVCRRPLKPQTKDCSTIYRNCTGYNPFRFGTWLEACLSRVGIAKNGGCGCWSRQKKMDQIGLLLWKLVRGVWRRLVG